eukprot:Gregarina_sp_Poly_1__610@NODE_1144_length_4947_cov_50_824180_g774_i1_p3_GENE_NODE_1144_length_4947_cov_50_824180_g774_i1NODE_1144_length_4947_cov_50_824180_g774_i1_p3_ORF_typecomplete_len187_score36_65RRM_1/PF00076_22/3_9e02RRM_1/PF00076_22/1_9e13Nup35_RRM_2/PF14605_6/1_8e03Nup35_RRM_2/PF14605_6/9_1e06Nup35_RRM_2/PF14605_6/4_7e03Nup35_RRM_2/PF14605_6/3_8e03RRM_5/PF13893_6/3_1e05RRM_3/PF08777_11/0_0019RRM_7/PF16367_5/0_0016RRM_occluded/PF16842_5/0_0039RL/PF17797_1/0_042IBN_N/PF03810_19/0_23MBDa/P
MGASDKEADASQQETPSQPIPALSTVGFMRRKVAEQAKKNFGGKRGVIRVSGMPRGLYEPQLKKYFNQFGPVTRVTIARSSKTANPKGWGYVEFQNSKDAETVASGIKRYLMFGRTLRFKLETDLTPEQTALIFKHCNRRWHRPPKGKIAAQMLKNRCDKDWDAAGEKRLEKVRKAFADVGLKFTL